jgi:hypothetical protein
VFLRLSLYCIFTPSCHPKKKQQQVSSGKKSNIIRLIAAECGSAATKPKRFLAACPGVEWLVGAYAAPAACASAHTHTTRRKSAFRLIFCMFRPTLFMEMYTERIECMECARCAHPLRRVICADQFPPGCRCEKLICAVSCVARAFVQRVKHPCAL